MDFPFSMWSDFFSPKKLATPKWFGFGKHCFFFRVTSYKQHFFEFNRIIRFFVWFTKRYSPIFRDVESDNGCMPVFLLGVSVGQVGGIKSHGELVSIFCDENRPWIFSEDIRCIITSQLPNPTFYMICYLPGVCDEPGKTKSCCLDSLFLTFFVVDVLWVSLFVQNSPKNETKAAKYYQKLNASQKNFLGVDKKAS